MHAVQVAVGIEKSEVCSGARKEREKWKSIKGYKKQGWREGEFVTDCGRRGERRMWCKHLLFTFCRTDTYTSYSVTESEAVGTTVCECKWPQRHAWPSLAWPGWDSWPVTTSVWITAPPHQEETGTAKATWITFLHHYCRLIQLQFDELIILSFVIYYNMSISTM